MGGRDRVVVTYLLLSVVWVLAMILLVDGLEGNRIRFSSDPLLWLLIAWALGWRRSSVAG